MMKVIQDNSQARKLKQKENEKETKDKTMETHKNYGKVPNYI